MLFATAELARSKVRFGMLTLLAGGLIFVLLFQQALLTAVLDGMAGAITHQSGPVVVFTQEAKRAVGSSLVSPQQMADVTHTPGVADVGELGVNLLSFRAPRGGERARFNASMIGFRPGRAGSPTVLREGRLPSAPDEIVASAEAASGRFGVGDTLTVETGEMPLKVVGLTEGALLTIGPTMWAPWETYEKLTKLAIPDMAIVLPAVLAVQPDASVTPEALATTITSQVKGVDAVTREVAAATVPGRSAIKGAFQAIMALCYLVVGVVIGFFFLTLTLQKQSSITLLRAVGVHSSYLVRCLVFQVALVVVGGLVVGATMLVLVKPLVSTIIVISADPGSMFATAVSSMLVAVAGAAAPIRRVLRTDPIAAVSPTMGRLK